jgi:site-specific recombinase XerD
MPRKNTPPSKTASAFFQAQSCNKEQERTVRNFDAWLSEKNIQVTTLSPKQLAAYLKRPVHRIIKQSSREQLHSGLKPYLHFLHAQGWLSFQPRRKSKFLVLPKGAKEFIDTLKPVSKKATCENYANALKEFHTWLAAKELSLQDINRNRMEQWLQHLLCRELAVQTRRHFIFHLRRYFEWLYEKECIDANPHELLRSSDAPKKLQFLPRPFPPEADQELQRRLAAGGNVHHQALLLMRKTGLRIGELLRLTPHCLEKDHLDNAFLKVPLGKLDNERLVPLDHQTRILLEGLQRQSAKDAEYLLLPDWGRGRLKAALCKTLKEVAADLDTHGPVVSHRLRHTYATELLNAGMDLVGIMRLLGHRDIQMTMRYAALTQITVTRDYHAAFAKIEARYQLPSQPNQSPDPDRMLLDTIAWLRKNRSANPPFQRTADAIIKRIHRIRTDISDFIAHTDAS